MKFESKPAQDALATILDDAKRQCVHFDAIPWAKFHNEALARAIEVAAKIELEYMRFATEHVWICTRCKECRSERPAGAPPK